MSVTSAFVALIGFAICLALVVGVGLLVHRYPALKGPLSISITTAAFLVALVVGVVTVAQATARDDGAGRSSVVSPSGR